MRRAAIMTGLLPALMMAATACAADEPPPLPQAAAPTQAPPPTETAPPPEPSESAAPDKRDEEIPTGPRTLRVAEGLRIRIEWPADPDPLVKLMVDQYVGTRKALAEGATSYTEDMEYDAMEQASGWLQEYAAKGHTIRGLGRIYNVRIRSVQGRGAQVDACLDESGMRVVSAATGKTVEKRSSDPYALSVVAHRGQDDRWRIRTYIEARERCVR